MIHRFSHVVGWIAGSFLLACQPHGESSHERLLVLHSPEETGVTFANQLHESEALNILTFEYFYNGAGVGVGDINNDNLPDLFFAANMGENRLYLNKGSWQFEDITQPAGVGAPGKWATGVAMVDINQDGWLDMYVCYAGPLADPWKRANELYINQQNGTFSEQAKEYGLADTGHSTQVTFFDYDQDGDLDMYLLTNITDQTGPNVIRPKRNDGNMVNTDRLYRNEGVGGNGHPVFTDVSSSAGITYEGYGLGVAIADINQDNWPDIYVSNDYLSNDLLYINNRDGTGRQPAFDEQASEYLQHQSYSAMGNDVADYNNDGQMDIITLDMLPPDNYRQKLMIGATNYNRYYSEQRASYHPQFMRNTLQLHQGLNARGEPHFSEIGQLAGIHATDWSWSALWMDIDNDGWRDLTITNGYPRDITNRDFASYKMQEFQQASYDATMQRRFMEALESLEGAYLPNVVFQNQGDLTFADRSEDWGFTQPSYSTGAAYADLDGDGDLDYVTNNTNAPAFLYENKANERLDHHYLSIQLAGSENNLRGIGTKVWCYGNGQIQYAEHYPIRGFQSTVQAGVHFGLGDQAAVDSLIIRWPDGQRQTLRNIPADQQVVVHYQDASRMEEKAPLGTQRNLFQKSSPSFGLDFQHQEPHYNDFALQPLLPHKYSQQGPGLAVGDVNGDGWEDFFVGGAFRQSGQVFIQQPGESFISRPLDLDSTAFAEDHGALLFDADQDGDQDLYVVSGGNEFQADSPYYQDRLYTNDGQGNFTLATDALPKLTTPGGSISAHDFDQDGDLDVFVGGRNLPQQFPLPGRSYLLENQQGTFVDVTLAKTPDLAGIGMVTSALWTDVNNDHQVDLMVVGEWMSPTVFKNTGGHFEKAKVSFFYQDTVSSAQGWWNSLVGGDFDQDGDTDYLAGNLGLNSPYTATEQAPLQLYVDDFNQDQTVDAILSNPSTENKRFPVAPRDDMLHQITQLKSQFTSYHDYAQAELEDVFSPAQLREAMVLEATLLESCYLENLGDFQFAVHRLPTEAQLAPVFGMEVGYFNKDAYLDVLLVGNSYATEVRTGRYDAFTGLCLWGDGNGNFAVVPSAQSGFWVTGDAKSIARLSRVDGKPWYLVTQNNDPLLSYELAQNLPIQTIPWQADDAYARLTYADGRTEKRERYQGQGYLSQSSAHLPVPQAVTSVQITNIQGETRVVNGESLVREK